MTVLSYIGQNNKWNNAADVMKVADDIRNAKDLKCLILEGNTLGIEAAREIGEALKTQPKFERAHWKDLFTGRLKNEIPQALKLLFEGVQFAGAKLKELDLSDNALGPLGVEGITDFLKSACHSLEELRLNNNGLGIRGGTMLAESLMELQASCEISGSPLQLKVFIAGRNRLENEGAKILAEFFAKVQSLEELSMPQNGIFHKGITALAIALSKNPNLRILNLNDNTLTYKGSKAIAMYLPAINNLEILNLGDCLIKSKGAAVIAESVKEHHPNLKELHLDSNEITSEVGLSIIDAVIMKPSFSLIVLNGNQFGEEGCINIMLKLVDLGKESIISSLEDDEEPDSDEEEEDHSDDEEEEDDVEDMTPSTIEITKSIECTIDEFINEPSAEHLLGIRDPLPSALLEAAKRRSQESGRDDSRGFSGSPEALINECIFLFFKCASLITNHNKEVVDIVESCVKELGKMAFNNAKGDHLEAIVTNNLLVHFGVIKSENKKFKITWNLKGALIALNLILSESFFFAETKNCLQLFFSRPCSTIDQFMEQKHIVMKTLFQ